MRTLPLALPAAGAASLALLTSVLASVPAAADQSFVDVPVTLKPLHFSADTGLGFGTFQDASGSTQVGWGSSFEAAVGLPFLGELGARIGYRFGQDGVLAGSGYGADHFGRLFDPVVTEPGTDNLTNPEFHLRGTLVPLEVFELGLETRVTVPTQSNSVFALTPGVPIRVHLPGVLRVDTGLWLPIVVATQGDPIFGQTSTYYVLDIPAQAYFQVGDAFVGPLTGLRVNNIGGSPSSTDIPLGVGGGYTFAGILDVKAQLRTERINSSGWASQAFGGGLGVGIRLP